MSHPFQLFPRRGTAQGRSSEKLVVHSPKTEQPIPAIGNQGEPTLVAALEILQRGEDLLRVLPRERYSHRVPSPLHASIGDQYRLLLEQFTSLLGSLPAIDKGFQTLNHEPKLESEPDAAVQATRCVRRQIELLTRADLARAIGNSRTIAAPLSDKPEAGPVTTVGRALAHATAVAIEHFAVISAISQHLDVTVPPYFGSAPLCHGPREVY